MYVLCFIQFLMILYSRFPFMFNIWMKNIKRTKQLKRKIWRKLDFTKKNKQFLKEEIKVGKWNPLKY